VDHTTGGLATLLVALAFVSLENQSSIPSFNEGHLNTSFRSRSCLFLFLFEVYIS
jgi:hypothetical protein